VSAARVAAIAAYLVAAALVGCGRGATPGKAPASTIRVGSKNFTEQTILGEIVAQTIEENSAHPVERRLALGGTKFAFEALRTGEIDVYPEYTATGLVTLLPAYRPDLHGPPAASTPPAEVLAFLRATYQRELGLDWVCTFGFDNTYTLAVAEKRADLSNVKTYSDLFAARLDAGLGTTHEFADRPDGLAKLLEAYGVVPGTLRSTSMDAGILYAALASDQVDAIAAFSTDGRIRSFHLRTLDDDRRFFPRYEAAVLVRSDIVQGDPELRAALAKLQGTLTDAEMRELNLRVDEGHEDAASVARSFLVKKGLVAERADAPAQEPGLLAHFWRERAYLARLVRQHLTLVAAALALATAVALPIGLALSRSKRLRGLVLGAINTLQTVPSLALLGFLVPLLGIGVKPAIAALFLYALLPIVRNTVTGIEGVSREAVEAGVTLGLTDMQVLRYVQIPLALPTIMAGIRTSAVILVGSATLSSLVGAGGLGEPIFRGLSSVNGELILLGAIPAALLAIAIDRVLYLVETRLVSRGIR
jgi:osmoprotectant transport system permease protein